MEKKKWPLKFFLRSWSKLLNITNYTQDKSLLVNTNVNLSPIFGQNWAVPQNRFYTPPPQPNHEKEWEKMRLDSNNSSQDTSIGSISAWYRGGPGFKSRQGREFFRENKGA